MGAGRWDTKCAFEQAIELSDVLMGNAEEEIMPLTGADSALAAAQYLCGGKRIVIAPTGSKGVLVATDLETLYVPAFQTQVVDTLGAGDAFNGGFIAARLANYSLKEATRWGNAVAALKMGRVWSARVASHKVNQMLG